MEKEVIAVSKEFNTIYDKVVEELRGNLTTEEYEELIELEYAVGQGYYRDEESIERYKYLSKKR